MLFSVLCFFFFQAEDAIRYYCVIGVQTCVFFFQAEDGIRDHCVTGVQTCALPISSRRRHTRSLCDWRSDVCSSDLSELQSHSDLVCRLLLDLSSDRSEEHTARLQSHDDRVCRLMLVNRHETIVRCTAISVQ